AYPVHVPGTSERIDQCRTTRLWQVKVMTQLGSLCRSACSREVLQNLEHADGALDATAVTIFQLVHGSSLVGWLRNGGIHMLKSQRGGRFSKKACIPSLTFGLWQHSVLISRFLSIAARIGISAVS